MFIVESYTLSVFMCFITMLCWGSWANMLKLAPKEWRFQLFYWDYSIGVLILTIILAFTMGSCGELGRSFFVDIKQAGTDSLLSAFLGGVIFNLANILLVIAIDIAGMSVAFPIGIGLALSLGVITNYIGAPVGNPVILFVGVVGIIIAIVIDAVAYRKFPSQGQKTIGKGIIISILAGIFMGFFYRFVAASMFSDFVNPEVGKISSYSALVIFSLGLLISSFLWNTIIMVKPLVGEPIPFKDYFRLGNFRLHIIGIVGGVIWSIGMSFSIIASSAAGFAISYGLGQGATMIAALWGVFIWKEFKNAPAGTNKLLAWMFVSFIIGLVLIIISRFV